MAYLSKHFPLGHCEKGLTLNNEKLYNQMDCDDEAENITTNSSALPPGERERQRSFLSPVEIY